MALTTTCSAPNERIAYDIIGPFKYPSRGNRYALTIQDDFTKYITFCALEDCTAESVAKALIEEWILVFGIPREILSDNGPQLVGEVMTKVQDYFGIDRILTSIGCPRSNGSVEKAHLRLAEFMRATENEMEAFRNWTMKLKLAAYSHNTTIHRTTGFSPHHLMFGTKPRLISAVHTADPFLTGDTYIDHLQNTLHEIWSTAKERTLESKINSISRDHEKHPRRQNDDFVIGQKVLVTTETLKGKVNRTEPVYSGPFDIIAVNEHSLIIQKRKRESVVNKGNCKLFVE